MTGRLVVTGGFSDWRSGSNRRFIQFIVHSSLLPPLKLGPDEINRERENGWLVHRLVASRFHVLTHRDRSTVNTSRSDLGPFISLHV